MAGKRFSLKAVTEEAIASGITPLEVMLGFLRAPVPEQIKGESAMDYTARINADMKFRLDAAKAAAPYCHPRVATEVVFTDNQPEVKDVNVLELARKVAFLFAMAENEQKQLN
jgi:hypothetical protein